MSGSKDRGVQFWDPQTGNAQMMLQGHKNSGMFFPPFTACRENLMRVLTLTPVSHLGRAESHRKYVCHRQWGYEGQDLEVSYAFLLV